MGRNPESVLGEAMTSRLDEASPSSRLNVVTTEALLERLHEWRRRQPDLPSKSEAARRLIEAALDADERAKPKPPTA